MNTPIPAEHVLALQQLIPQLQDAGIIFAVVGSTGLALQGVDLPVHDIDILTTKEGAQESERLFLSALTKPVRWSDSDRFSSWYGKFLFNNVQVEIMGALVIHGADGDWRADVTQRSFITLGALSIPVLPLRIELEAYRRAGRIEKAEKIEATIRRSE
jgi:hypothetical protein